MNEIGQRVEPRDVIFGLGANAGYLTMVFAAKYQHIYVFEPMKENISRWKTHISVNDIMNTELFPIAVSDCNRTLFFAKGHSVFSNRYERGESIAWGNEVKGRSRDTLVQEGIVPPPTVLKINVEGAALDVLHGAKDTIKTYRPLIFLATHYCHNSGVGETCLLFLDKFHYDSAETKEKSSCWAFETLFVCQNLISVVGHLWEWRSFRNSLNRRCK